MHATKFKAQGMYPTPAPLARTIVFELFEKDQEMPRGLLEPSAGFGGFILEAWEYWLRRTPSSKRGISKLVQNTFAFENDRETFSSLKDTLFSWCKKHKIDARPNCYQDNFILAIDTVRDSLPENLVVIGNPPWDEFTTRKHDNLSMSCVEKIRRERELEKQKYGKLGCRNLYQAFLHALLTLRGDELRFGFVLPRQILGDMNSAPLRKAFLRTGKLDVTVYRNADEPSFYFEAVDDNSEIAVLNYRRRRTQTMGVPTARIRRGYGTSYMSVAPNGDDWTIPCPFKNVSLDTLAKLLSETTFGTWSSRAGLTVSRGKVLPGSEHYRASTSGRTIRAYQCNPVEKNWKLVLNKILPNSRRKLKAALVSKSSPVADSLLVIETDRKELYPYLMLMLNSRAVELALRSLTSNINLNNFRVMSLPIPEPSDFVISQAQVLLRSCLAKKLSWDEASDRLTRSIFSLTNQEQQALCQLFPERVAMKSVRMAA